MRALSAVRAPITVGVLLIAAICVLLLVVPGTTVTSRYLNDIFIFLDGGYRVAQGQVPNRDFHTALGPLSFYIPGIGYALSGRMGMAMPVGMSALILAVTPILIHVLRTRMRPSVAMPAGALILLVLATPHNTGEIVSSISFAMFYNRVGWGLLAILLMMYLIPQRPARWQTAIDATCATLLVLAMLYTKISYGLVGWAFLVFVAVMQPQGRRWAVAAFAATTVSVVIIGLIWGGTFSHIADIRVAAGTSGSRGFVDYLWVFMRTFPEYIAFGFVAGLALWRTRSWADFLFFGFCSAAGLALIIQNFQERGVIAILAGAAVAAELLARDWREDLTPFMDLVSRSAWLLVLVLMLPVGIASATVLGLHAGMGVARAGTAFDLPNADGLRVAKAINKWDYQLYRGYANTLETGGKVLASLDKPAEKVLVLDFVSPFTSLVGLTPPASGTAWMHDGRNFDRENFIPVDSLMGDVEIVMIPKKAIAGSTTKLMREIYGDYFKANFARTRETADWIVLERNSRLASGTGGRDEARPRPAQVLVGPQS